MLRPNLAVADRSMNALLGRKSLPGKVIHRLRPHGHHPARRGRCVTVTQWCARRAYPAKTTNRHSAGIRAAGTHYPTGQLVRHQTSPALSCLRGNMSAGSQDGPTNSPTDPDGVLGVRAARQGQKDKPAGRRQSVTILLSRCLTGVESLNGGWNCEAQVHNSARLALVEHSNNK
jgi:hypothetical protein